MPVEVVRHSALVAVDEPVIRSEEVVADLFAYRECFNQLFDIKRLPMATRVNDHWPIALVANQRLKLTSLSVFSCSVLIEPLSFPFQTAQIAVHKRGIVAEDPLEACVRLDVDSCLFRESVGSVVGQTVELDQVTDDDGSAAADSSGAHH